MADFKILVPSIPFNAALSSTYTLQSGYGYLNTRGGSYTEGQRNASASTLADVVYTLSTAKTCNYLVLSNFKGVVDSDSADPVVRLYYIDNSTFYSFTVDSTDLVGRDSSDFVTAITTQTDDYFKVRVSTTESIYHELFKVFLGEAFEFSREPVVGDIRDIAIGQGARKPVRSYRIVWEGVTDTEKTSFVENVIPYTRNTPIFLWDTQDRHFYGEQLLYAKLDSYRTTVNKRDTWRIETNWTESI
jgi:hypothetical protein